jgi:alkanesulfonate monooxygenase SsuD/methylene tetrahydromethanopterin reductase-like flavin-dependent oxidoreductase (luciferase family)
MAADTCHATVGALVTCFTYRNPQLLADMSRTIDHISDGRFVLGIGSGWFERDYTEYGYEFGTAPERLKLLAAGIPVIKERLAKLTPGGSGEKVTLKLTAQYADSHNAFGPVDNFRHKMQVLDQWCEKLGRNPREIERTVGINAKDLVDAAAYEDAGADHLIVMTGSPFDLEPVEKYLAQR